MQFFHSDEIWRDFPELVAGVVLAHGINFGAHTSDAIAKFHDIARSRLSSGTEADFPEIQAWRRAFARMGLKPTQYRCASEALLRRFRKDGIIPQIHPLIDLCNSISLAFAIPIAAFDLIKLSGDLEVRYAAGDESYLAFSGQTETPDPREVIFADASRRAHARRWTNRQSAYSAVSDVTSSVLLVAEAMHARAAEDVGKLLDALSFELERIWSAEVTVRVVRADASKFRSSALNTAS